ncbi:hypothetical protein RD149_08575 [Gordonia westfalica]|uniref:Uncharacterized protein n=1 Tax=Gordonia westfalica TaxID=158898 RepID=A0ABU2GQT3_9ACTN|nr:hypothetical protein [Gordonia westfalica]MDS1113821.1 hypothetical protein [Gordonia westfalica]
MYELQLTTDEYRLLMELPNTGEPLGNTAARRKLGLTKSRYARARQGLLDKQLVLKAPGQGGALRRAPVTGDSELSATDSDSIPTIRPPVAESKLYGPIRTTLGNEWADDRGFHSFVIEETAHQGRRRTGGSWTRPDLVAIGTKTFKHVPHQQFEVVTFEVKPMEQLNAVAVFEALAHRRASTHAYVLVEVRDVLATAYNKKLETLKRAASDHGIGVITFGDPSDYETWTEEVVAQRSETSPELLNDFIETQISQPGQEAIESAIKKSQLWLHQ